MKRIFLDTNFLIDYLVREDFRGNAERVMFLGSKRGYRFLISYLSVANFAYIMRKENEDVLKSLIKTICQLFEVLPNNKNQILLSLDFNCRDYEDTLQVMTAIEGNCEIIITRNSKDFTFSKIRIMTPDEFIKEFD